MNSDSIPVVQTPPSPTPPFKWKGNTAVFLVSQAISLFGSSLVQFAITAYITAQTKSPLYATVAILCAILPTFVLSPFAGVWADRFNRKTLIMVADGGIAACTLVVAILFLAGYGSIPLLLGALAVRALGAAVQTPCVGSMLPDIVPEEHLSRINGINGSVQSLFTLASPVLGAALLPLAPLGAIFFIDIVTAVAAIVIMLTAFVLPAREKAEKTGGNEYFKDMLLGARYIGKTPFLMEFFLFCICFFFLMAPAAFLTQVQVVLNYPGDEYLRLSAIEVAFSVGMLAGGLVITLWGGFKNRVYTMALAALLMGLCTIGLGILGIPFVLYVGLMGLFGMAMPLLNTSAMTLLQERVEPAYMGRVFSVMTMLNTGVMPLGMVLFGPLSEFLSISIEWLLLATGAAILVITFAMTRARALLAVGRPRETPPDGLMQAAQDD